MAAQRSLRTTDFALLGVLAQGGAMSGYDAKAYIDASISQFWSESFGQIYPALDRLKRRGLVRSQRDGSSARGRKVYEITDEGRTTLRAWLSEPPEPERPRSESILKTFLGDQALPGVTIAHLRDLAQRMEHRAAGLRQAEAHVRAADHGSRTLVYSIASIRAGIHISEARAAWARECITLIEDSEQARS